jgi:hypothetical protein
MRPQTRKQYKQRERESVPWSCGCEGRRGGLVSRISLVTAPGLRGYRPHFPHLVIVGFNALQTCPGFSRTSNLSQDGVGSSQAGDVITTKSSQCSRLSTAGSGIPRVFFESRHITLLLSVQPVLLLRQLGTRSCFRSMRVVIQ